MSTYRNPPRTRARRSARLAVPKADGSSTVYDADTVILDEVPSMSIPPPMPPPPLPTLTATATATDFHHQQRNINNVTISNSFHSGQENYPANTISELLRHINSQRSLAMPSTTATATATRSEEISRQQANTQQNSTSTSKSTTKTSTRVDYEEKWQRKIQDLLAYKEKHGNVDVPKSSGQLGQWVMNQRAQYKLLKENKKTSMTDAKIKALENVGFRWSLKDIIWNDRFLELCNYKEKYGNTNASQNNKNFKSLGVWVVTQRNQYKLLEEKKHSNMTLERIQMLNSIGFQWKLNRRRKT